MSRMVLQPPNSRHRTLPNFLLQPLLENMAMQKPESKNANRLGLASFKNWWPIAESNHGHADFQDKSLDWHQSVQLEEF